MSLWTLLKTAYLGLKANKLRSILTTLGIIIGVGTVISMVSIIDGMNKYVYSVLGDLGTKTVYVQKWQWIIMGGSRTKMRKLWREVSRRRDLTMADVKAIEHLDVVDRVAAYQPVLSGKVKYKSNSVDVNNVVGTDEQYIYISGYEIDRGRNFMEQDIIYNRRVAIIGSYVAKTIFENENPIGKSIIFKGHKFTIIGVLKEKGELMGNNLDDLLLIPVTVARKFYYNPRWRVYKVWYSFRILVKFKDNVPMKVGMERLEELLRVRRGLRFDQDDDFALNTSEMLLGAYKKLTSGIFIAMIGIASLALIVGGIGIMNIMLVSVTERTREIGIRMAVGAKRKDILYQFLFESIFLTTVGGLIGVFLGFIIAKAIDMSTPLPASMPVWSVLVGLGFSSIVGLFFGIYPANKASKMDPIEALRYE